MTYNTEPIPGKLYRTTRQRIYFSHAANYEGDEEIVETIGALKILCLINIFYDRKYEEYNITCLFGNKIRHFEVKTFEEFKKSFSLLDDI